MPDQVGDIENVHRTLAEGRDMRRGDVETEVGNGAGQIIEKARPVEARRLDDGELVRQFVVDQDLGLQREGLQPRLPLPLAGNMLRQAKRSGKRLFYEV